MSGQTLFRSAKRPAVIRLAISGVALAGLVTLAGCGGSDDVSSDEPAKAPASSAPASSAPASSAPASSAPASSDSEDSKGDDSGKPSQDEVADGLTTWYENDMGISGAPAKLAAKCLAGKIYSTMSAEALTSLADGKLDPSTLKTGDAQAFADASGACAKDISGS